MYVRDLLEVCNVSLEEEIIVNYLISIKRITADDTVRKLRMELHQFLLKKKGKRILTHFILNFTDATMNWFSDKPLLKTTYAKQRFNKNENFDTFILDTKLDYYLGVVKNFYDWSGDFEK